MAFLQELCSLAKHLQLNPRAALWGRMAELGLFQVRRGLTKADRQADRQAGRRWVGPGS